MTIRNFASALVITAITASAAIAGGHGVMVGGVEMVKDKNIVENLSGSSDHTTLVAAVTAAGLVETLQGDGPFTVLAPTNAAFDALPEGTVDNLLMPENLEALGTILTCHVVAANAMAEDVIGMITDGNGMAKVGTVGGCELTAEIKDDKVMFTDENGTSAAVTIADVGQSNGVVHVIDAILLPKQ